MDFLPPTSPIVSQKTEKLAQMENFTPWFSLVAPIDPDIWFFSKHWHKQKFENLMWLLWAIKRLYSVGMPFTFTIHHHRLSDTLKVTIENTVILRDGIVLKRHSRTIAEWFQLRSIFRDEFFFQLKWRRFVGWGVSRRWGDKRGDTHFYLSLAHLLIVAYFPCVWQILVPSCGLPSPFH